MMKMYLVTTVYGFVHPLRTHKTTSCIHTSFFESPTVAQRHCFYSYPIHLVPVVQANGKGQSYRELRRYIGLTLQVVAVDPFAQLIRGQLMAFSDLLNQPS